MEREKIKTLAKINILHDKIRNAIENEEAFDERFESYKALIYKLNDGLVEINDDKLKESYKNEVSIIIIIENLLKYNLFNKVNLIKLDDILNKLDELQLFTCYNEKPYVAADIEGLDASEFSYEEIIDLFPQKQTIADKKLFGQYYTPNFMVDHVLNMVNIKKEDIYNYSIVDPACGNGAFLIKIIDTIFSFSYSIKEICNFVNTQLFGFDINPSAIFLCKLSIYLKLINHCKSADDYDYVIKNVSLDNIKNINTITSNIDRKFNVIIGNPPYFKITNGKLAKNTEYSKILNGQGNIYTLFMQWSILHIEERGDISLIVPQSFRSGKYFKNIRTELCKHSLREILTIDTKKRNQVFLDAEQAILIMHLVNDAPKIRETDIYVSFDGINVKAIGRFNQFNILSPESLILPINDCANKLLLRIKACFQKFQDVEPDLTFGNGLFVWNQNKKFLSSSSQDTYPVVYANYILNNSFEFDKEKNDLKKDGARKPFCCPNNKCESFVCTGRKLIVKRTSGIENFLRIKSCVISDDFILQYPKYYLENHINFLYDKNDKNKEISINKLLYISAYLSSDIANFIFKLMNGNTQVSATELNSLPFVYKREKEIVSLMKRKTININKINEIFFEIFDLSVEEIQTIKNYKEGFSK